MTFELTVQFHAERPENEPIGDTLTLVVTEAGFHDAAVVGTSGDEGNMLSIEALAAEIARRFGRDVVEPVLEKIDELREALGAT